MAPWLSHSPISCDISIVGDLRVADRTEIQTEIGRKCESVEYGNEFNYATECRGKTGIALESCNDVKVNCGKNRWIFPNETQDLFYQYNPDSERWYRSVQTLPKAEGSVKSPGDGHERRSEYTETRRSRFDFTEITCSDRIKCKVLRGNFAESLFCEVAV
jgi:hypothetical protein